MTNKPAEPKKIRITIDLTPDLFERLEKLAELTGAASKADVVRDAIHLYGFLAKNQVEGVAFGTRRRGDEWERVLLFRHLPVGA